MRAVPSLLVVRMRVLSGLHAPAVSQPVWPVKDDSRTPARRLVAVGATSQPLRRASPAGRHSRAWVVDAWEPVQRAPVRSQPRSTAPVSSARRRSVPFSELTCSSAPDRLAPVRSAPARTDLAGAWLGRPLWIASRQYAKASTAAASARPAGASAASAVSAVVQCVRSDSSRPASHWPKKSSVSGLGTGSCQPALACCEGSFKARARWRARKYSRSDVCAKPNVSSSRRTRNVAVRRSSFHRAGARVG